MASTTSPTTEFNLNLFTLSFPPETEKAFQKEYFTKSIRHVRIALLLAIFMYGIFGILDAWIAPEVKHTLWLIRYAIFLPSAFAVFLFSFSRQFEAYMQLSIAAVIMMAGFGIIGMILVAPYPGHTSYYAGLILVSIYGYTFFKLRFIWATLASWTIVLAYECAAGWLIENPVPIFLNNNFFFLAGNIIGMSACYSIELYARKDFVNTGLLESEKRKAKAFNRELEKRVADRTAQLVVANDYLKQEIEERKRAEIAARASEERFKNLSENSPEIIYTLNCDGTFSYVNPAWQKVLGHAPTDVIGKYFVDFVPAKDTKKYVRLFKRIRDIRETITDITGTLVHKNGAMHLFSLSGSPNLDSQGEVIGMVGFLKDITEQQKLQTQLLQAQKMESIGTLAGGVAHDFNNILSAIIGYSELAELDVCDPTKVKENLKEILKASQRAKELVQQILSFSRQDEEALKPVEIELIVKEALKLLRASLPSTIEIRLHVDPKPGIIEADPTQIHQLLMNLCTNAAFAMNDEGGVLEVSLNKVLIDTPLTTRYLDIVPGTYTRLTVRDTGHGMPPLVLEKIFDPYFTTKKKGKGTGLGLAVVHGIVQRHRGGIGVESAPGKGTTFHVYFPSKGRAAEAVAMELDASLPKGGECILFLDDEEDLVNIGAQMLSHLGYKVVPYMNSVEALELFRADPAQFDLVITDMTMPKLTGDKLAKELIKIRPDIPIILCTGYSASITEEQAKDIGIKVFSPKPLVMRDLAETTRRVLDEKKNDEPRPNDVAL
ncbi:MAG: PAS domain S-box protein [Desulfobacterales bacterium]|nr:MAG: PAS domain S-box protein [Desulfobacterales bacterium]